MVMKIAAFSVSMLLAGAAFAQTGKPLTNEQLTQLTANGITLQLGGPGQGYTGTLKLTKNGKGKGSAVTDAGDKLTLTGTWSIEDGKFCRSWAEFNGGQKVCETWYLMSSRSVDVYNGSERLGVNSW